MSRDQLDPRISAFDNIPRMELGNFSRHSTILTGLYAFVVIAAVLNVVGRSHFPLPLVIPLFIFDTE